HASPFILPHEIASAIPDLIARVFQANKTFCCLFGIVQVPGRDLRSSEAQLAAVASRHRREILIYRAYLLSIKRPADWHQAADTLRGRSCRIPPIPCDGNRRFSGPIEIFENRVVCRLLPRRCQARRKRFAAKQAPPQSRECSGFQYG